MGSTSFPRWLPANFKRHWPVLFLALIVGILCIAPHIYARNTSTYAGIHLIGSDAEEHYDARIQEVRDGFPTAGNTFLPDKKVPAIMPALAENVMAFVGALFHVSTPELAEIAKFIFPFFAAIVMYVFGYLLLRSRIAACLGTAIVLLGDNLISGPAAWKSLLSGSSDVSSFLTYSRPINPELTGILLFAALALIVRAFFSGRNPRWYEGVGIGALAGVAFYPSPYVASFILCLVVIEGVVRMYRRDWSGTVTALTVGITALVCLMPFFLEYRLVVASPWYQDAAARFGSAPSHAPSLGMWVVIMLVLAVFAVPKRFREARSFFLYSAIALLILLNQQILTGHALVSAHYHWYITKPLISFLAGMFIVVVVEWVFHKRSYLSYATYGFVIGILILNAVEVQVVSFQAQKASFSDVQRYAPIMRYLNTLPHREFIWANSTMSAYIPMYTRHDTANNPYVGNYLIPTEYLEQQLFVQYRLRGVSEKDAPALMQKERGSISSTVYLIRWRELYGSYESIPETLLSGIEEKYEQLSTTSTAELLKTMGVTMLIWDQNVDPTWHLEELPMKKELFRDEGIVVYSIGTSTALQ